MRHPHHYKISIALALSAGAWGIYWLLQRILEDGVLTGGWGTISQMVIGFLLLLARKAPIIPGRPNPIAANPLDVKSLCFL